MACARAPTLHKWLHHASNNLDREALSAALNAVDARHLQQALADALIQALELRRAAKNRRIDVDDEATFRIEAELLPLQVAKAGGQQPGARPPGGWAGRWILTAGLGGMGGAQPLAATFAGAVSLNIECQQSSIDFRLRSRYLDEQAADIDDALARIKTYKTEKKAVS